MSLSAEPSRFEARAGQGRSLVELVMWLEHQLLGLDGTAHKLTVCGIGSAAARRELRVRLEREPLFAEAFTVERPQRSTDGSPDETDFEPDIIPYP